MATPHKLTDRVKEFAKRFSYEPPTHTVDNAGYNLFGFFSPGGGKGVTTLVMNIAHTILLANKTVAVVDMNAYYPGCARFVGDEEPPRSLVDKFINPASPLMEYGLYAKNQDLVIFGMQMNDDTFRLAQMEMDNIRAFFREVSATYDYVLIDIKGSLNDETVVASIDAATVVFNLVRPTVCDIEYAYKDSEIMVQYKYGPKLRNIIQTMVTEQPFEPSFFKESGMRLVTNVPFCQAVAGVSNNYEIFVTSSIGADIASKQYREAVKFLAESIINYGVTADKEA